MKRQARKVTKRVFSLLLVTFLLGINSFAAVLSDNDGSAFITKAEFDSLKNNFQAQIDQYNQSIDAKIDGAIASYLSGIKLDEAKHYKVFGKDNGILEGEKNNNFYLISLGNWQFDASNTGSFIDLISATETNRGYGIGYWLQGCTVAGRGYTAGEANVGFIASGLGTVNRSNIYYKVNNSGTRTGLDLTNSLIRNRIANMHLSDQFKQLIKIYNPDFKIFQFLDSGDVTFKIYQALDGYTYEGALHRPGTQSGCQICDDSSCASWDVQKLSGGTYTVLKNIKTLNYTSGWISITTSVKPGDEIYLSWRGKNTEDWASNQYMITFFSNTIPGWELETT